MTEITCFTHKLQATAVKKELSCSSQAKLVQALRLGSSNCNAATAQRQAKGSGGRLAHLTLWLWWWEGRVLALDALFLGLLTLRQRLGLEVRQEAFPVLVAQLGVLGQLALDHQGLTLGQPCNREVVMSCKPFDKSRHLLMPFQEHHFDTGVFNSNFITSSMWHRTQFISSANMAQRTPLCSCKLIHVPCSCPQNI